MDEPGTITWEEFLEDARHFLRFSDEIPDGWELRGDKGEPGGAYLARRGKVFVPTSTAPQITGTNEECVFQLQEDPLEAKTPTVRPLLTEHHVLWSMSYGVPVLYFNGWFSDFPGVNTISTEEAQALVPGGELHYTELSQAIHPLLGSPFLQLHPCMSRELLQITRESKNKLVSWLSVMAPAALGLKLRPEYCELTVQCRNTCLQIA